MAVIKKKFDEWDEIAIRWMWLSVERGYDGFKNVLEFEPKLIYCGSEHYLKSHFFNFAYELNHAHRFINSAMSVKQKCSFLKHNAQNFGLTWIYPIWLRNDDSHKIQRPSLMVVVLVNNSKTEYTSRPGRTNLPCRLSSEICACFHQPIFLNNPG